MSVTKKLTGLAIVGVMACGSLVQQAQARPPYLKAFNEEYPQVKALAEEAKCGICHPGKEKKERNDYGAAMGKALGEPKVMDPAKLKDALKKIESEKSATAGKTFGDLLKDGKLPGAAK